MNLAESPAPRNDGAHNLAGAAPPPVSATRAAQFNSLMLVLLAAAQRRIARLEEFDRAKAVELDRLCGIHRRRAA